MKIRIYLYDFLLKLANKLKPREKFDYPEDSVSVPKIKRFDSNISHGFLKQETLGEILDKVREDGYRKIENYQSTFIPSKSKLSKKELQIRDNKLKQEIKETFKELSSNHKYQ